MFSWQKPRRFPIVVAHRGSSATAPENTLAAFRQAIDDGADAIELDVHLSRDNYVVVIHDRTITRTTDGRGNVRDLSLSDLRQFSGGSWFHKRFSSERIPSLAEVFDCIPACVGMNIEIKAEPDRQTYHSIVEQCLNEIRRAHRSGSVLLSSFHHPYLRRSQVLDPSIPIGCLYHPIKHVALSPVAVARSCASMYVIVNGRYSTKSVVERAHESGLLVGEYTVDTQRRVERALRFGVDAMYTNKPAEIRRMIFSK